MRTGVRVAREQRFLPERGEFLASELLVDLLDLRRERIPAGSARADVARDLRAGLQRGAEGFDLPI